MAITNIPTFTDGEIPSAAKLNQLGTAVTTKFSGAVTGSDMVWPLVVQGNIDMNSSYTLTNLRTLWSVVNVNEYDNFSDAVAALPASGGCLLIPPGTTVTIDGETVSKAFCVLGCGKTSVVKITSAASSGYMIRTAADLEGVDFVNVTLDGNAATGSGQDGIQIRKSSQVNIVNCWFKNWSGDPLYVGNDGTGGNNSAGVRVHGCHFEGGSGRHLFLEDVDGLDVSGCTFENPTTICIEGTPTDANAKMRSIRIHDNEFSACSQFVDIKGASATANDLWRLVSVYDNDGLTSSGDGITVGDTTAIVKSVRVCGNTLEGVGGDGIVVLAQNGRVSDNEAPGCTGDGLDMTDSQDLTVKDNNFSLAGANGIDATNSDDCLIHGNNVLSAFTEGIVKDGTTGNTYIDNPGDSAGAGAGGHVQVYTAGTATSTSASGQLDPGFSVPAGSIKAGDVLRVRLNCSVSGTNNRTFALRIGGADCFPLEIDAGSQNVNIGVDIIVTATTGAATLTFSRANYSLSNGNPAEEGGDAGETTETVDWTTDTAIDLSFTQTAADTVALDMGYLEIVGQ